MENNNGTICFIHACTINNNYSVLLDLLKFISKFDKFLDLIIINNIGDGIDISIINSEINIFKPENQLNNKLINSKIYLINYSPDISLYESPTINLLLDYALNSEFKNIPNSKNKTKILYLHTKGIRWENTEKSQPIKDWVNIMLYFMLEHADICIKLLDNFDTIGINFDSRPFKHYSGNYWWGNTNYIRSLKPLIKSAIQPKKWQFTHKYQCEWWILSNNLVNYYNLYSSAIHNRTNNINHYRVGYARIKYDTPFMRNRLSLYLNKSINKILYIPSKTEPYNYLFDYSKNIQVFFGNNKFINITKKFKPNFIKKKFISIPKNTDFTNLFGLKSGSLLIKISYVLYILNQNIFQEILIQISD